jgi:hypothetical protein
MGPLWTLTLYQAPELGALYIPLPSYTKFPNPRMQPWESERNIWIYNGYIMDIYGLNMFEMILPLQYSTLSLAIIRSKKRAAALFKRQWCPVKVAKTAMVSFENAIFSEHVGKIHHFNFNQA